MKRNSTFAAVGGAALLAGASLTLGSQTVTAADHADSPAAAEVAASDITDFYAWHTGRGTIVAVVGFAGLQTPAKGFEPLWNRDVLYTIHVDNTADPALRGTYDEPLVNTNDNESDLDILVRFGPNLNGDWGVQVENLPGSTATFSGPVETELDGGRATRAWAGVADDPFFFDFVGFQATIANLMEGDSDADLAFASLMKGGVAADTFAGLNAHTLVLEFDAAAAGCPADDPGCAEPNSFLQLWASTGTIAPE
jgi:hypothetical protein